MITDKQIEELLELESRATAGEWDYGDWSGACQDAHTHGMGNCNYKYTLHKNNGTDIVLKDKPITIVTSTHEYCALSKENAEFIAASRNAFRALLTEVKESREVINFYENEKVIKPEMDEESSSTYFCEGPELETWGARARAHLAKFGGGE